MRIERGERTTEPSDRAVQRRRFLFRLQIDEGLPSIPFPLCIVAEGTTNIICHSFQGNTDPHTPILHLLFSKKPVVGKKSATLVSVRRSSDENRHVSDLRPGRSISLGEFRCGRRFSRDRVEIFPAVQPPQSEDGDQEIVQQSGVEEKP